jgi:protein-S-isoprenylcysteine O-methyltransferase Ste14
LLSAFIIIIFFVVYAVLHSWLAALAMKNWARRTFGPGVDRWYRLIYNIIAVVTLLPFVPMLVWLPDATLYVAPSPWRWLLLTGQAAALVGLTVSLLQTGLLHFLGLRQLVAEQPVENGVLSVRGFYGWVRHPLYFFSSLLLWLTPVMTVNWLTVCVIFTLYFYLGSFLEERRLLAEFGPAYGVYQQRVSRFIPWKK